ncbi:hypothetical protein H4J58_13215 [Colwellia sp. MB3u-70]|uniref:hypothetical protein n=1 Tax=unclassified Colwellia TaxID=196834 RepID=UPI0015F5EA65|nr:MULTISPECIES: hypothetical protein [unclassified Colwellia]MBA6292843.1 hypothetical protein [Colwellia sp. MB3u-8]MBA6308073.1 hypothetical protein [Colwellia sp. MB3u-70]
MGKIDFYQKLGTRFITKKPKSNPTQTGYARKIFVLYVIGRFGFSSKIVCQYALQLPREAINKLFRKLMIDGLINERKSFGSKDGAVYYLSAKGKRYISFETEVVFHQKTDTSAHNSKTEIHDLSIQICVLDRLLNSTEYSAFVTEKELREMGYGSWGELKKERSVDSLLCHADTRQWHAVEIETANSKNKKTAQHSIREEILNKYVNQLESTSGLYSRILFFSHRERFLRQIKSRTEEILAENKANYTIEQQSLINTELKYVNSFCPTLYQLFWDMDFKLEQSTHTNIEIETLNLLLQKVKLNDEYSDEFTAGYEQAISDINSNV